MTDAGAAQNNVQVVDAIEALEENLLYVSTRAENAGRGAWKAVVEYYGQ